MALDKVINLLAQILLVSIHPRGIYSLTKKRERVIRRGLIFFSPFHSSKNSHDYINLLRVSYGVLRKAALHKEDLDSFYFGVKYKLRLNIM